MKLSKYILFTSALLVGAAAYADDFDSFGDFGSFGDDTSSGATSALEVNGSVDSEIRAYVDVDEADADKVEMDATPSAALDLKYSGTKSDVELSLKIDEDTIKNHPADVIDEAVLRGYFGNLTLEAGKMKVVWGKGDKLHVLDNFNADDYSDFIIPDYLDRRISTPMIRAVYSLPFANMNIEGVYTPLLPVDRFATDGRWTPAQVAALTESVTGLAKQNVASAFTRYTTATATAGTLNALAADTQAAQKGYQTAYQEIFQTALSSGKITAATPYAKLAVEQQYGTGAWDSISEAQKNAAIQAVLQSASGSAIEEAVKAQLTKDKIESLLRSNGYGYYLDNLTLATSKYAAACEQTGFTAETIKTELTAAGTAYMYALTNANNLSANPDVIYPDLWTLKYNQFGTRATWTLGQVDMGLSYYYGWYKQPSFNASKLNNFLETYLANGEVSESDKFLAYDRKQTFGLEMSSIIWHFNVRGEFAYNLTDDTDGTDPWVHNNSIAWLGGFDIDLPFWNANLNVQETGSFILNGDECDKNTMDVDYNKTGYTNNKIVANVTTSFLNDKVAPEVTVMYGIERGDLVVMPKLAFKPDQNLTLTASGMYIHCADEDSEFYPWRKNSFVSIGANYQF